MTEPTPEAYEAAARAYCRIRFDYRPERYASDEARQRRMATDATHTTQDSSLRAMVDAVWPLAEAQVRAKVAAEIRAEHERIRPRDMRQFDGLVGMASSGAYENAARIAEGKGDET